MAIRILGAFLPLVVLAQPATAADPSGLGSSDAWHVVAAGGGVYDGPKFPGSDSNRVLPLPYFDIRHGDNWFLNALDGLGVRTSGHQDWWLSLSAGPDLTHRNESDDTRLTGLGDVHYAGRVWAKSGYSFRHFTAAASLGTDITGKGQGTIADFEFFDHHYPGDRWEIDDGTGLRWANAEYTRTFFGVSAQQSAQSGLPQYSTGGGLASVDAFVRVRHAITDHWMLVSSLTWTRLEGDAVDSPITESRNRFSLGVFVVYGF
ncbi:MAG TPA: MipA/OmpV family protein [Steroidobacteraceae bacterium]|nr:MipA/OmpV family protein [Steroidobacteraceae bacterium]